MDNLAEIKQTFFQECEEQLTELEVGLISIQNGNDDAETVNAIFRAVHSIKGGAGAFGYQDLVSFAHAFETSLEELRSKRLTPSSNVLRVFLRASDQLADLVSCSKSNTPADTQKSIAIEKDLLSLCKNTQAIDQEIGQDDFGFTPITFDFSDLANETEPTKSFAIKFRPKPGLYSKGNDAFRILRELNTLGEMNVQCSSEDIPTLNILDPEGAYLTWDLILTGAITLENIRDVFEFVEWDSEINITELANEYQDNEPIVTMQAATTNDASSKYDTSTAKTAKQTKQVATIRTDLNRIDRLINLVGELVINQSMLSERAIEAGIPTTSAIMIGLEDLAQLTREIQDGVMAIRAQSVKNVFQRMPRIVREVAEITGKSVRLVTDGENTEVDKTVIDHLTDPLTHMIRNAIDHGIETPEVRLKNGKPEEGTIHLSAAHRSGRIVIEIKDDGAGIDRTHLRTIAEERGITPPDAVLSDDEVDNLIFHPGFSTAKQVSNVSGRGVGMDVVRKSINALGGRISISSIEGQGSTFTMSLPLTLAVLDGMVVTVADQTLIIPLTSIVESLQPKPDEVHKLDKVTSLISIRGSFVPVIDIAVELGYRSERKDPTTGVVILVETEGKNQRALLVDGIQGQRQVVIKSLETNYGRVDGIAAATITGDGKVALILDVDAITIKKSG